MAMLWREAKDLTMEDHKDGSAKLLDAALDVLHDSQQGHLNPMPTPF
jgi:hypothetical protein